MEANSISVLQQLASNPQLIDQLQNLLSIITPRSTQQTPNDVVLCSSSNVSSPSVTVASLSASPGLQNLQTNPQQLQSTPHPQYPRQQSSQVQAQQRWSGVGAGTTASPDAASGVSLRRYEQLALRCRHLEDQLSARAAEARAESDHRAQLEREVTSLLQRVEEQQSRLNEATASHKEELRRRDEAHEAAMRQLVAARRMVDAASTVAAPVSPAAPVTPALQLQSAALTNGAPGSGAKRERPRGDATTSRPRTRRRTPRTPSLTVADRAAAAAPRSAAAGNAGNIGNTGAAGNIGNTGAAGNIGNTGAAGNIGNTGAAGNIGSAGPVGSASSVALSPAPRVTAPFVSALSPGPATSTLSEAMARHRGAAQTRFVTQYANPLHVAAPLMTPPHASRTPRARGQRSGTSSIVAGPTRSPSPVNPKRGAEQPRRFVVTSLSDEERARVRQAVAALGQQGVVMDSDFEDPPPFTATHIIVRGAPRSMKALCGVVAAKWLVAPEYVYDSCSAGFWLDEYEEGGLRCFPPPLKCQRFLLTMPEGIVKEKLEQVIEYGGGEVLRGEQDGRRQSIDQGVIVITSGDELLRFATRSE